MRKARLWYFLEFNPETMEDYMKALFSENSAYARMVLSYWDMAAALVNHGAISKDLFTDTNGEHIVAFAKLEPILGEIRAEFGPQVAANLEKLIDATPDGRQKTAKVRERTKEIRARAAAQQSAVSAKG